MQTVSCSCGRLYRAATTPTRGPDGNEAWLCLWCTAVICGHCYHVHTTEKHLREDSKRCA